MQTKFSTFRAMNLYSISRKSGLKKSISSSIRNLKFGKLGFSLDFGLGNLNMFLIKILGNSKPSTVISSKNSFRITQISLLTSKSYRNLSRVRLITGLIVTCKILRKNFLPHINNNPNRKLTKRLMNLRRKSIQISLFLRTNIRSQNKLTMPNVKPGLKSSSMESFLTVIRSSSTRVSLTLRLFLSSLNKCLCRCFLLLTKKLKLQS